MEVCRIVLYTALQTILRNYTLNTSKRVLSSDTLSWLLLSINSLMFGYLLNTGYNKCVWWWWWWWRQPGSLYNFDAQTPLLNISVTSKPSDWQLAVVSFSFLHSPLLSWCLWHPRDKCIALISSAAATTVAVFVAQL